MKHFIKYLSFMAVALSAVFGLTSCSEDENVPFGYIEGVIIDSTTGDYITSRAVVTLTPGDQSSVVTSDGTFSFYQLEPGRYTVSVTCDGYESQRKTVSVVNGERSDADFMLTPSVGTSDLELQSTSINLNYGTNETTFRFRNAGINSMNWEISGITVPWLSVTPTQGTLSSGAWATVNVSINRNAISTSAASVSSSFIIRANGSEFPVQVVVRTTPGGNESQDDGKVSGCIFDSSTRRGIAGALIILSPGAYQARSDANGIYSISDLPSGVYKVMVSHSHYAPQYVNVTVNSGANTSLDIYMDPIVRSISVDPTTLDFGTTLDRMTVTVRHTGNSGDLLVQTDRNNYSWLDYDAVNTRVSPGKELTFQVYILRKNLTEQEVEGTFNVICKSTDQTIPITVKAKKAGGGSSEGDYSSARVTTCDSRIEAKIVSCKRSGSSVVFNYTLTNTGIFGLNDWRIYPPHSMSMISGGSYSRVWDNVGTEYGYPTMTFRDKTTTGSNVLNTSFPTDMPCSGSVTVKNVPSSATELNVILGVYAYPNSQFNLAGTEISFRNVPIY